MNTLKYDVINNFRFLNDAEQSQSGLDLEKLFLVREKNMSLPKPRHSSDSAAICPGQPKYGTPKNNALTRLKSLSDKGMVVSRIDIYGPYNMGLYNAFPCYEMSPFNSNHCKAAIRHQSKFRPVRY